MKKSASRILRLAVFFSMLGNTGCAQLMPILQGLLGAMAQTGGMPMQQGPLGAPAAANSQVAQAPMTGATQGNLSNPGGGAALAPTTQGSSLDQAIDAAAKQIAQIGPGEFPYAPGTEGGNLGCAQVASTALQNAGAIQGVELSVNGLVSKLQGQGWGEAQCRVGAIVARQGSAGSHIGVVIEQNGSLAVMHNSSGAREPRITSVEGFGTITITLYSGGGPA
jgi:hypothetical protein